MISGVYPEDVVVVIIKTFVDSSGRENSFSADREIIHKALYKICDGNQQLQEIFRFRNRGFFPGSEVLDQALSNLTACGIIEISLNTIPRYYINGAINDCYKETQDRLSAQDFDCLKNLAPTFWQEIFTPTPASE